MRASGLGLAVAAAAGLVLLAPASAAAAVPPLALRRATLAQQGGALVLRAITRAPLGRALSDRRGRICLALAPASGPALKACVGGPRGLRREVLDAHGRVKEVVALAGTVTLRGTHTVVVEVAVRALGLRPGPVAWSLTSRWAGPPCSATAPCVSRLPRAGPGSLKLTAGVAAACVASGPELRMDGPAAGNRVALTFDDGPGPATPSILAELEKERLQATFFVLGDQTAAHAALLRRMLADGDAIGDHSWSHPVLSGDGGFALLQITQTADAIAAATGYRPCLFRAPYGATSAPLLAEARDQGLLTIGWDVDPVDWSRPGVAAIVATTMRQVHAGSIILMHDGGGDRSQTVAALPLVIAGLRARGLHPVTVPVLLGLRR